MRMQNIIAELLKKKQNWISSVDPYNTSTHVSNRAGFTLIELIVVTGLLVVIGALISSVIVTTLRTTSKTKITSLVSQNGNYALSVISDIIHDSDAVVDTASDTGKALCTISPTVPVPSSQIILHRLRNASEPEGGYTTIQCTGGNLNVVTINGLVTTLPSQNLLDPSQVILAAAPACSFTCVQADVFTPPTVSVKFGLVNKNSTGAIEKDTVTSFTTQISLNSYIPR